MIRVEFTYKYLCTTPEELEYVLECADQPTYIKESLFIDRDAGIVEITGTQIIFSFEGG